MISVEWMSEAQGQPDPAVSLKRVLRDDGHTDPAADPFLSSELLLRMHREMCRIRVLDARMVALQRQGRIAFFGSSLGQEATPVAAACAIEPRDWVFPALRESAIMLVRGFPLEKYLAQVFGNQLDVLKGRQMPSHLSARAVNQVSWSSCIATQLPHAVGAAWAAKKRGDSVVTLGFLGDGATSQPDFHAAMNFAAVFKAPCVIICQNNQWSLSLPVSRQTASQTLALKARAYGMPGIRVDGNDVLAVHSTVSAACERARRGGGPTFIEALTYRLGASSTVDDPSRYRSEAESREWESKDPINRLAVHLRHLGVLDDLLEQTQMQEINDEISAAIAAVEHLPPPERASLFEDVYQEQPWHLREQCRDLLACPPVGRL
jgi:pyruvate dehydrogenase E1 component alpha subunit/2-oxoisovalerate dehydrogenase E1 component alpha subunit